MSFMKAGALHRMIYNMRLVDTKTPVLVLVTQQGLEMSIWDGHERMADWNEFVVVAGDTSQLPQRAFMINDTKALELWLRDFSSDSEMPVEWDTGALYVNGVVWGEPQETYDDYSHLFNHKYLALPEQIQFALNPKRMRKFSTLKPGDYPLYLKVWYHTEIKRTVVLYSCGPVDGVIITLDQALLKLT